MGLSNNYIQQIAANTAAINRLISDARNISQLPAMQGQADTLDLIAIYQASTQSTVKTPINAFFIGLGSNDIENQSQLPGVTVSDALNETLNRTSWQGIWVGREYRYRDQVRYGDYLMIANTQTSDEPFVGGVQSPDWDLQVEGGGSQGNFVTIDTDQTITGIKTFTQPIYAFSFVTDGGTQNQFVKGDGSLDNTVYVTQGDFTILETQVQQNTTDIGVLYSTKLNDVDAGTGILIDKSNPLEPVISAIPQSSAGIFNYTFFTADLNTLAGFYDALPNNKGTIGEASMSITSDGETNWFANSFIGNIRQEEFEIKDGTYSGILSVQTSNTNEKEEFIVEVYEADANGIVINSGITDAPIGSLGVQVIAIMTTGVIDLPNNDLSQRSITGTVSNPFLGVVGNRVVYRVGGRKATSAGNRVTLTLWFGFEHLNAIAVPIPINTDTVDNKSNVAGATATDALNSLQTQINNGTFLYEQPTPSVLWEIIHPMNKYPSVSVIDSAGTQVSGEVNYISKSELTITFNAGFTGTATLN